MIYQISAQSHKLNGFCTLSYLALNRNALLLLYLLYILQVVTIFFLFAEHVCTDVVWTESICVHMCTITFVYFVVIQNIQM